MAISLGGFSGGSAASTDTLDDVTGRGASTTNAITVGGLSVGTAYTMPSADGGSGQAIVSDGAGNLSFTTIDPTGALQYKGSFNATTGQTSAGTNLNNAEQGDYYKIDTAGTIYGQTWAVNDSLIINANMGGVIDNAKIDKIDNTDAPASETVAGVIEIATNAEATAGTATDKALVPSNLSSIALSTLNNDLSFVSNGDNVSVLTNDAGYLTSVASASETVAGVIEIATNAEATSASATDKALVPSNLSSINVSTFTNDAGYLTSVASASETVAGKIEIATNAEATAGTATDKALVPSNLAGIALSSLNNDLSFVSNGDNVSVLTNDAGYLTSVASASETVAGKIEIATNAEATAASATDKALVPSNLSGIALSTLNNDLSFLSNVVEDTTPQLGGNLDTNQNEFVTASNRDLILRPNGTGHIMLGGNTNPAELHFYCETNDHHYVGFKAPAHSELSGDQVWRLPTADASTSGDALVSDGAGNLSFTTISGGGGYTYSAITADPATAQFNYHYSCTSGTFTITLPAVTSGDAGKEIRIKNMGTGTITIDGNSSSTIDGQTTIALDVQFSSVTLVATGNDPASWEIV